MAQLLQLQFARVLLVVLAVCGIVGIAAACSRLGTFYFDARAEPAEPRGGGPVSWHLSRWSENAATPRNEMPEWVINKPGDSRRERSITAD